MSFTASSNHWMTVASHNLGLYSEKYALAKGRIEKDRRRIRGLQDSVDDLAREKRQLSSTLETQCKKLSEAEEAVKKAGKDKEELTEEMSKLVKAQEKSDADIKALREENERIKKQLQASEAGQASKDARINELEREQTRLTNLHAATEQVVKEREELLGETSDIIDGIIYRAWQNKGIGRWSADYEDWMKKICRRSVKEARRAAIAAGTNFSVQQHLASTFTDDERAAIGEFEYSGDSTSGSDSSSASSPANSPSDSPSNWSPAQSPKGDGGRAGNQSTEIVVHDAPVADLPLLGTVVQEGQDPLVPSSPSPIELDSPRAPAPGHSSGNPSSVGGPLTSKLTTPSSSEPPMDPAIFAGLSEFQVQVLRERDVESFVLSYLSDFPPLMQPISPLRDFRFDMARLSESGENPLGQDGGDGEQNQELS